jgi:hypothetical protein
MESGEVDDMRSKYVKSADKKSIQKWISKLNNGKVLDTSERDTSERDALKELKLTYKNIGTGKHRIVYDLGSNLVLKIARVEKGILCNQREVSLYQSAPPSLRKHLCKILEYGHGWLIMRKMDRKLPKHKKYKKQVYEVYDRFCDFGVRISDVINKSSGNPKQGNIRLNKKNRVVLIDYANTYPWPKPVIQ